MNLQHDCSLHIICVNPKSEISTNLIMTQVLTEFAEQCGIVPSLTIILNNIVQTEHRYSDYDKDVNTRHFRLHFRPITQGTINDIALLLSAIEKDIVGFTELLTLDTRLQYVEFEQFIKHSFTPAI